MAATVVFLATRHVRHLAVFARPAPGTGAPPSAGWAPLCGERRQWGWWTCTAQPADWEDGRFRIREAAAHRKPVCRRCERTRANLGALASWGPQ